MYNLLSHLFYVLTLSMLLVVNQSHARNIPDELLHTPITLISGDKLSLSEFDGKTPVYMKFWATWCQPCRQEMPHLEEIHKKYGDKVKVISINIDISDSFDEVQKTIKEFGLSMPIAIDSNGDLTQAFKMIGTPYHLLFDKNMNLIHRGHEANKSLDNKISLLAQTKPVDLLDPQILSSKKSASDIKLKFDNKHTYALFFTSTWCDWYLKDSRPETSQNCIAAQKAINSMHKQHPDINWTGIISRLWADNKELSDYTKKYSIQYPQHIDTGNSIFHKYNIKNLPTLIVIKDNKVVSRIIDFSTSKNLSETLSKL